MGKMVVDRRQFAQILAMAMGAATMPSLPAWAQGAGGKKRNVVIGHTGITWPNRPPGAAPPAGFGRRGGSDPAAAGAAAPGGGAPAAGAPGAGGQAAAGGGAPGAPGGGGGRRGAGGPRPPQVANPEASELIFHDVATNGFAGLELFDWQIKSLESQGLLAGLVEKFKLPLVSSYTGINLTEPAQRADTIANAVAVGKIIKKYGGRTIVIGPSSRAINGAPSSAYVYADHKKDIVDTLNEVGKAVTGETGLIAALHQHTGTCVETREETYQTMDAVDTRVVKFGPDIGQLKKGDVDPVEVVKHYVDVVQHMHFKDYIGGQANAGYCPLGEGTVDLVGILDIMDGRKIGGMIMVELDGSVPRTPTETAKIAHDWLVAHGVPMKA